MLSQKYCYMQQYLCHLTKLTGIMHKNMCTCFHTYPYMNYITVKHNSCIFDGMFNKSEVLIPTVS